MKVLDVLKTKGPGQVCSVTPDTTLADAVALACSNRIGALLVVDGQGKLVGIFTERDVLHQCNAKVDFATKKVGEVMTRDVVTVSPAHDIHVAMDMMVMQKIRHLPVVQNDKLLGIITVRDVIYSMRKADEADARMLLEYIRGNIKIP